MPDENRLGPATTTRIARLGAGLVAMVSAAAAVAAPPAPTGRPVVDGFLVGGAVAAATWIGGHAPWWLLVALSAVAGAIGVASLPVALGVIGVAVALVAGVRRRDAGLLGTVSAGLGLNALARGEVGGFLGLSAIVGVSVAVVLVVAGAPHLSRRSRRLVWSLAGVALLVGVVGTVASVLAGVAALDDLRDGRAATRRALDAFDDGDLGRAADEFDLAADALGRSSDEVGAPLASLGGFVPVLAQHRSAVDELARTGATATAEVAAALRQVDPEALRLADGRIDVAAVAALSAPFRRVEVAVDEMRTALDRFDSPWIVDRLTEEVALLDAELDEQAPRLDNAATAIDLAPGLLGAGGSRTYLALFTTPSEARGLGGLIGNYAEIKIADGRITMPRFGRVRDLELIDAEVATTLSGPPGFLDRYGELGYDGAGDGRVGDAAWRNLTVTPHLPWVGEVGVQLYRQETGVELDGVIVVDPFVVQSLLAYTGPIELAGVDVRLDERNAADYLLRGQYERVGDGPANQQRIDALELASRLTFDRVLDGNLPDPLRLIHDLAPLVEQRRLLVWTTQPQEQAMLGRVGLLGSIPPLEGGDGWSFTLNNAGGGKIDAFLQRAASYESETDTVTGVTTGTMRVELTNTAPARGLPSYVIGNVVGLPEGTSRLLASFYSPLPLVEATIDGHPLPMSVGGEAGWGVSSSYIEIPSGATVTVVVRLRGVLDDPDRLVTWQQPLVTEMSPAD